jgi:hypothetical protein
MSNVRIMIRELPYYNSGSIFFLLLIVLFFQDYLYDFANIPLREKNNLLKILHLNYSQLIK